MKLWDTLSKENKEKLAQVYENLTGKKWVPEIKDISSVDKIMRQKPQSGKPSKGAYFRD